MEYKFKDIPPGLFRGQDLLVYSKLKIPINIDNKNYTAILIGTGGLVEFKDTDTVWKFSI